MGKIILRQCTVSDAKKYYLQNKPIKFVAIQTYGGKDIKDNIPSIESDQELSMTFTLDGNLMWKDNKESGIISNWFSECESDHGPYLSEGSKSMFYYLGGEHSEYGYYWMQICSKPLNVLSQNCMDEVNIWIPV